MTREKAIITLENYLDYWKKISDEEAFPIDDDIEALSKAIEALQEQKTGKNISKVGFLCSCCSFGDFLGFHGYKPRYCPNCGTRMESEEAND